MKIAMLDHKGGGGKTTSAVMLAYVLGAADRQVGIKDLCTPRNLQQNG